MIERETIEEALENDRCGICGSVDHFREDHPPCLACPPGCPECSQDESDCECYTHQDDHPDAVKMES